MEVYDAKLKNVLAFMQELKLISGLPDDKLGIYSRALLWNSLLGDHSLFKRFLCWVARYCSLLHPWNDAEHMRMQPWAEPNYWQFSADGNNRGDEFGVDGDDIDLDLKFIYSDQDEDDLDWIADVRASASAIREQADLLDNIANNGEII